MKSVYKTIVVPLALKGLTDRTARAYKQYQVIISLFKE